MAQNLAYRSRGGNDPSRVDENEDEDEEDVDETGYKTVKDAVLFAIEVSDSMLHRPPQSDDNKTDTNSPLSAALTCAYHLMQQRIIAQPKDLMGILLYGTEATKFTEEDETSRGGWSFPHCYLLTDLAIPEADDVKLLKDLVVEIAPQSNDMKGTGQASDRMKEVTKPAKEPVPMHSVFFCANQIFQNNAANFASRRLFIVTDNDNPHATNKALRSRATVRAKDLYDLGIIMELFPISTPKHDFDTKPFYDDIIYRSAPSDPNAIAYMAPAIPEFDKTQLKTGTTNGISLLQSLLSTISSRAAPKRALFSSVPLEIAPDLKISVKGYLLYKRQKPARSCYVYLGADKPQIVQGTSEVTVGDAGGKIEKAEVRKAYTFGGEQIVFKPEEITKLRHFGDPIIRIVGFRPVDVLPRWANIKTSTFLYPSEEDYVGSTRVYSALYQKLVNSKRMALTWFIPRRNATPVMAAMLPTLSAIPNADDEDANVTGVSPTGVPQGLHLIPLPFADDLRPNPASAHEEPLRAPEDLVEAMRPIIQQLTLPKHIYDPSRYSNPSLQWHYRILQALALDEDLPAKPEDKTVPKYRQIDKRIGHEAIEWGRALEQAFKEHVMHNPDAAVVGSKRPNGKFSQTSGDGGRGSSTHKKVKEEGVGREVVSEEKMREVLKASKLASLTVQQLKDFLASKKMPITGKKVELVERIEQWFEDK